MGGSKRRISNGANDSPSERKGKTSKDTAPQRRSQRATAIAGPRFSYRYNSSDEEEVPTSYAATVSRIKRAKVDDENEPDPEKKEESVKSKGKGSDHEGSESDSTEPESEAYESPESSSESESEASEIEHNDLCEECGTGGTLLCCDFCPRVFHLHCLDPPLSEVPDGIWSCPVCKEKGMHKKEKKKKGKSKAKKPSKKRKDYDDESEDSGSSVEFSDDYEEEEAKKKKKKPKKAGGERERDKEEDVCDVCADGGFMIVCERCDRNYHLNCLDEPLSDVPEGVWICPSCVEEQEGTVDRIICWRTGNGEDELTLPTEGEQKEKNEQEKEKEKEALEKEKRL